MSKILTVCNHKGGVGKTTTVVNLAAEFGRMGYPVLVVDLDPQGNASMHIGQSDSHSQTSADLLLGEINYEKMIGVHVNAGFDNVHLIHASRDLITAERQIREKSVSPYSELRDRIATLRDRYNIILIDTGPHLDLLTGNAIAAADSILIPIETKTIYGLHGTADLMELIERIENKINPSLTILGVLLTRHNDRLNLSKSIEAIAEQGIGNIIPISIRETSRIGESSVGQTPVRLIDKRCSAAEDYEKLAEYIRDAMCL